MDKKKAAKLERHLEKAIIEVICRLGLKNLPLLPAHRTMKEMARLRSPCTRRLWMNRKKGPQVRLDRSDSRPADGGFCCYNWWEDCRQRDGRNRRICEIEQTIAGRYAAGRGGRRGVPIRPRQPGKVLLVC
jgi:hypothetical protein